MSNASVIYAGYSSMARFASLIKIGEEPAYYGDLFSEQEQYNIVLKHLHCISKSHNKQKAYSAWFLHIFSKYLNKDLETQFKWAKLAKSLDGDNLLYDIAFLEYYLKKNQIQKAVSYADDLNFNYIFMNFLRESSLYNDIAYLLNKIKPSLNPKTNLYKLVNLVEADFKPKKSFRWLNTAVVKLKDTLSYKLGDILINSKLENIKDFISLLKALKETYIAHKMKLDIQKFLQSKDENFKQPSFGDYNDFNEMIKLKKSPTYKAGQKFIQIYTKKRYFMPVNFCLYFIKILPALKKAHFKA